MRILLIIIFLNSCGKLTDKIDKSRPATLGIKQVAVLSPGEVNLAKELCHSLKEKTIVLDLQSSLEYNFNVVEKKCDAPESTPQQITLRVYKENNLFFKWQKIAGGQAPFEIDVETDQQGILNYQNFCSPFINESAAANNTSNTLTLSSNLRLQYTFTELANKNIQVYASFQQLIEGNWKENNTKEVEFYHQVPRGKLIKGLEVKRKERETCLENVNQFYQYESTITNL